MNSPAADFDPIDSRLNETWAGSYDELLAHLQEASGASDAG